MILVSDDFTRADANDLGANWTAVLGTAGIVSNQCGPKTFDVNGQSVQRYSAVTWPADQFSEITLIDNAVSSGAQGPAVRYADSADTGYVCFCNNTSGTNLAKKIAGVFTGLATLPAFNSGDVVRLAIRGTELTVYRNGIVVATATDSAIASGSASLNCGIATARLTDNWYGGSVDGIDSANIAQSVGRYIGWIR